MESGRAAVAAAQQEAVELATVGATRAKEDGERVAQLEEQASVLREEVCIVRSPARLFARGFCESGDVEIQDKALRTSGSDGVA